MKVYEVYEPDVDPTSTYERTEAAAMRAALALRKHGRRVGVYECELVIPSGRVGAILALLNGVEPVRGDLLYGRDWANRPPAHLPDPETTTVELPVYGDNGAILGSATFTDVPVTAMGMAPIPRTYDNEENP